MTVAPPRAPRLVDATLVHQLRDPGGPIDAATWAQICRLFPAAGVPCAVPAVPHGAFAAAALAPLIRDARVIEPVSWPAHHALATVPMRRGTIIADPVAARLDAAPTTPPTLPDGAVREAAAWIPNDLAPADLDPLLDEHLRRLPEDTRLRLRDPHGHLTTRSAAHLATRPDAARLSVIPEDRRGIATAIAQTLLEPPRGPTVHAALLARGPRAGHAALEHLVDAETVTRLHDTAQRLALLGNAPIPQHHPLWGSARDRSPEPDAPAAGLDATTLVVNIATLPVVLDHHMQAWGLELTSEERERLLAVLTEHLRPGDHLDGPRLWAIIAGTLDLRAHATRTVPRGAP